MNSRLGGNLLEENRSAMVVEEAAKGNADSAGGASSPAECSGGEASHEQCLDEAPRKVVMLDEKTSGAQDAADGSQMTLGISEDSSAKRVSLPLSEGVVLPVVGQLVWAELGKAIITWLSDPFNIALLVWIVAVAVAGAILFLVMTGMLNAVIPEKADRDIWAEAANQVLTALFTLWCLLVLPWRIIYAIRVCRWSPLDRKRLREVFSRAGPENVLPNERLHLAFVVFCLNLNCVVQFCLAGIMWGIRMQNRSALLVAVLLSVAIGSVAVAGLYCIFSPLGRPRPPEPHMTLHRKALGMSTQGSFSLEAADGNHGEPAIRDSTSMRSEASSEGHAVSMPIRRDSEPHVTVPLDEDLEWDGALLSGCFKQWRVTLCATICCCYTFGSNLSNAGFGNRYLHAVMLLLFLAAPFLICEFAALQISDKRMSFALVVAGVLISYLGLLYGGYWRHQLVKTFRLPGFRIFGTSRAGSAVGDFFLWVTCCFCALCQEVRTVQKYGLHVQFDPEYSNRLEEQASRQSGKQSPSEQLTDTQTGEPAVSIGEPKETGTDDVRTGQPSTTHAPTKQDMV